MKAMAPTREERIEFACWLMERPDNVLAVANRFDPWSIYRLKTTGQHAMILGFHVEAPTTVKVQIYAEHPDLGHITGRRVFGIDPDDLELLEKA